MSSAATSFVNIYTIICQYLCYVFQDSSMELIYVLTPLPELKKVSITSTYSFATSLFADEQF